MEIEKGMAVNADGLSDNVREAVVKKFEMLGFVLDRYFKLNDNIFYIGRISGTLLSRQRVFADFLTKITIPDLMFCDQPDEITHCYYEDGKLYYFNSDEHIDPDFLICTREPAESKNWHEKGELPPVGEVVEANVPTADTFEWKVCEVVYHTKKEHANRHRTLCVVEHNHGTVDTFWASKFRPVKSEREKLIEDLASMLADKEGENTDLVLDIEEYKLLASYVYNAGWRPSNESSR